MALAQTYLKTIGYLYDWREVKKIVLLFGDSKCRELRQFGMIERRVTRRLLNYNVKRIDALLCDCRDSRHFRIVGIPDID